MTDDGYVINLKDQTFSKDGEDIDVIRVELVNYSEDVKVTLVDVFEDFLLELRCSNEYFVCPGYYKIEIVNSSPHIRVRLVENFEDIRIAIK